MLAAPERGLAQAPADAAPRISRTELRPSRDRGFVPERSFIVNRGDRLYSYQLRFHFNPQPKTPLDFQTIVCRAERKSGQRLQFAYRNQTIPASKAESDPYFVILPVNDLAWAACEIAGSRRSAL